MARPRSSQVAEKDTLVVHVTLTRDEVNDMDAFIAENPGILNRTSVARALMRLGIRLAKKDRAQLVAPTV